MTFLQVIPEFSCMKSGNTLEPGRHATDEPCMVTKMGPLPRPGHALGQFFFNNGPRYLSTIIFIKTFESFEGD